MLKINLYCISNLTLIGIRKSKAESILLIKKIGHFMLDKNANVLLLVYNVKASASLLEQYF